jgi:hypothetical protein
MRILELFNDKKPLFVCRPLLNVEAITEWAAEQNFASTMAKDMHVTVAFSKQLVDWRHFTPQRNRLLIRGGTRKILRLGDKGAVVLAFQSKVLAQRWREFCDGGASWEHEGYQAHITITYNGDDLDLESIQPFTGDLVLGPEHFNVPDDHWVDHLEETDIDAMA